jgi:hypothetical protein
MRVIDGLVEGTELRIGNGVLLPCIDEGNYSRRPLGHPRRLGTRCRRRRLDARLQLRSEKGRHALGHRHLHDLRQFHPTWVGMIFGREVHRGFVQREAEQAVRVGGGERYRDGAPGGVPVQVEAAETPVIG